MKLPHSEHGDGPAVLLLHAGIADRRMWDEHLEPLANVDCPVLLAAGEDDLVDFKHAVRELAGNLPGAKTTLIAGCGHLAPLEAPEEFRRLVLENL